MPAETKMIMPDQPFTAAPRCPKCLHESVSLEHEVGQDEGMSPFGKIFKRDERLVVGCNRCGYHWSMATADSEVVG